MCIDINFIFQFLVSNHLRSNLLVTQKKSFELRWCQHLILELCITDLNVINLIKRLIKIHMIQANNFYLNECNIYSTLFQFLNIKNLNVICSPSNELIHFIWPVL